MRCVLLAVSGFLLLTSLAAAQQPSGEQLYVLPPKGWDVAYHDSKGNIDVTEVLPPGQTLKNWTEMLTVQMISGQPVKTPQDVLTDQVEVIKNACEDIGAGRLNLAVENGYETALRAIACPKSKQWGDGELSLYKVISGRERAYVVWRSWRGPAFDKEHLPVPAEKTTEWLTFMQQVMLCDEHDPKHSCLVAQGGKGAPAGH
ncbi:hypothetical protein [Telmatospirillum sp.]|uniref:hypothetical protein n=1 Tax=Telmatospirillum sp. TaxID=2079197 RepID=UPI00283D59C6|nr:hypothetical protein [Telmatospirillum sp.]MDR3435961.1 hypothetical protein [Telmatospirillum sp.]